MENGKKFKSYWIGEEEPILITEDQFKEFNKKYIDYRDKNISTDVMLIGKKLSIGLLTGVDGKTFPSDLNNTLPHMANKSLSAAIRRCRYLSRNLRKKNILNKNRERELVKNVEEVFDNK